MQRLWGAIGRSDPVARDIAVPTLGQLLHKHAPSRVSAIHRARRILPGRVAAVAGIAAALLLTTLVWRSSRGDSKAPVLGSSEFVTDTAEMATARLDDGSVVRLAPSSRLRVSHGADARDAWLDGEAFFAVTHDKSRPFRIRTRAGTVEVLGTRFDLRVEASELRLIVTEGLVALEAGGTRREVAAGEIATVGSDGLITVAPAENPSALLPWTKGFLVFQDTPLRLVAREIEERYGVRVLLPDSAVASRTLTAWFTHQNVEQVLAAVCRAVQAHCTLEDGVASIEP